MLGTQLAGRYKLLKVLGAGGFGQTYVAEDTAEPSQPPCVVKHFQPPDRDPDFLKVARRLFHAEIEALEHLGQFDQIPLLLNFFEEQGEFYLVQELIDGPTLEQEIEAGGVLDEATVVSLLEDILGILAFIHDRKVIHRDIKPGNLIRRQKDGRMVLIDFGAVKEIQTQLLTQAGQTNLTVGIGTQGYTPAEQLAGKPRYSSDIYALGITAIQALTGIHPSQLPEDPATGELRWLDQVEPDRVSEGLKILLNRMAQPYLSLRYASASEVLRDLGRLEELPHETVLTTPVASSYATGFDITQIPTQESLQQSRWQGLPGLAIASLAVVGLCLGVRQLGGFQPLELAAYDQLIRLRPDPGPDPRLLVVEITEEDLRLQGRSTPSDQAIADVIAELNQYNPQIIGLDLHRELPQEPGHERLMGQLKDQDIITITKLGDENNQPIPPPDGLPATQVGFNDLKLDPDEVIRRNLLFATDLSGETQYSFSLRLALAYLVTRGISPQNSEDGSDHVQLGAAKLAPLERHFGGYQTIDDKGFQIPLDYRSPTQIAERVTLTEVLNGTLANEQVEDKVVLIGTTAPSSKDLFSTPYRATNPDAHQMAGVIVHAHQFSHIVGAALGEQPITRSWPDMLEILWMMLWAGCAGGIIWWVRRPLVLLASLLGLIGALLAISILFFVQHIWLPVVAPLITLGLCGGIVTAYRAYLTQQQQQRIMTMLPKTGLPDKTRLP